MTITTSFLKTCGMVVLASSLASPASANDAGEEIEHGHTSPYHEIQFGLGGSREGAFALISWTGKRRVGVYFKPHLLDDDKPMRANSTVVEESASDFGLTFRAHPVVTLGAGFGVYERDVSVYGGPSFLFGVPVLLEETEERDSGPAGVILLTSPDARKRKVGWSFGLSGGPAGFGASIQLSLHPAR